MIEPPSNGSERILSIRLLTTSGPVHLLSIYAPTLCSAHEAKDQFYEQLHNIISSIPNTEYLFLLGDFNARVGADHDSWPSCLGRYGIGRMNENGQRLLELCTYHNLCITNSFFHTKPCHQVSWRHPRSRSWHQLDLIVTRRPTLNSVQITRSFHSADCDTDHSLVCSKVRLRPKKLHHSKQKGHPRINTSRISHPQLLQKFLNSLVTALQNTPTGDAETKWAHIRDAIYESALTTYGKSAKRNADWFQSHNEELEPVIAAKRIALLNYKKAPSDLTSAALKAARSTAQRTARRCANDYWQHLCSHIQLASDTGNIRGMYDGMKRALGPTIKKIAPPSNLNRGT
ncbi:craniofacial development protein 2-like [Heterodontus francisci]|uniref:craniofacial development protein 2-like n=1 Tax=Heterodontus francisci TaxID=7792 RepID=UPI00355BD65E